MCCHPKPTCTSRVMNGAIFFVCLTSWKFSMFSDGHFRWNWKGKHHVEESLRKEDRKRSCGSKTEVCLFDFTEPDATLVLRFGCFCCPGVSAEAPGNWRETPTNQNRATSSQERGMATFWSRKLRDTPTRWCVCDSSGSCGKLQRRIVIQLEKTGLDHNLQVTRFKYVDKVFTNLRHELNRSENDEMFDLKTNVLIWWLVMQTTMKSAIHIGREYQQTWPRAWTRNSKRSRRCSISPWGWLRKIPSKFWNCLQSHTVSLPGWDRLCVVIK